MYEPDFYRNERYQEQFGGMESMSAYTAKTFFWMFLGLMTTFLVALAGYVTGITIYAYVFVPGFSIITLVAELAVVLILSSRIQHLSVPVARVLFFAYAALTGVVFSLYFYLFDLGSLILVFAATAVYFAGLALYGYFTKTDLFRLRPILVAGLILLLIFALLSLLFPFSQGVDRLYCLAGIAIFLVLTAYDTQNIKSYYLLYAHDPDMARKASIFSALQLYLDFINLFLYLLRFLGRRKN